MARIEITDELWALIEPHIPVKPRRPGQVGLYPIDSR